MTTPRIGTALTRESVTPCPHCGGRGRRLEVYDDVGAWLWTVCQICSRAWGWPDPQRSLLLEGA